MKWRTRKQLAKVLWPVCPIATTSQSRIIATRRSGGHIASKRHSQRAEFPSFGNCFTILCMGVNNPIDRVAIWLATGLGVGLVAAAPGTIGGLWGLPLAWWLGQLDPYSQKATLIVLLLISVGICSTAAAALGGGKDPQSIVLDEIAALPITFLGVGEMNFPVLIAGFLLFRLFDITKPPPCKQAEQLPSGWGIMADDCVAALYACLALNGLIWLDRVLQTGWLGASS